MTECCCFCHDDLFSDELNGAGIPFVECISFSDTHIDEADAQSSSYCLTD